MCNVHVHVYLHTHFTCTWYVYSVLFCSGAAEVVLHAVGAASAEVVQGELDGVEEGGGGEVVVDATSPQHQVLINWTLT